MSPTTRRPSGRASSRPPARPSRRPAPRPRDIAAIGLTNQRETTIVWERATGRPVADAIVWQSRITAPYCEELRARGLEPLIRERTGLPLDAYFSGPKIRHILRSAPGLMDARRARRARLRHRGHVPAVAPDRWPGPRHGRLEREPDDALRHPAPRLGRRPARGDGDPAGRPARGPLRHPRSTARPTRRSSGRRSRSRASPATSTRRRSGRRASRRARPRTRTGPGRSSCSSPGDRRSSRPNGLLTTVAWRLGAGRPGHLRARGLRVRGRRRGPVAARRAAGRSSARRTSRRCCAG